VIKNKIEGLQSRDLQKARNEITDLRQQVDRDKELINNLQKLNNSLENKNIALREDLKLYNKELKDIATANEKNVILNERLNRKINELKEEVNNVHGENHQMKYVIGKHLLFYLFMI
jgi:chromosome segregation ATPase